MATGTPTMNTMFKRFGFWGGCSAFAGLMLVGDGSDFIAVMAIAAWMLIWWITEAVPIAVTALLPLVLFPLTGTETVDKVAAAYGSQYVFLFMGGFILALAMEKWMLHKRIALAIVAAVGTSRRRIVLGFMLATALLSMWISNTATTLMMLPIAMSVIAISNDDQGKQRFTLNLLLGIAYAANCGGIATLVGTPPNVAMAGTLSSAFGIQVGFTDWLIIGLPFSATLLFVVYILLTRVLNPMPARGAALAHEHLEQERRALGPMQHAERSVLIVFTLTALLWVFKDMFNAAQGWVVLNDSSISMAGGLALFMVRGKTSKPLLEWTDTAALPWGILLLFGGGMALANGLKTAGLIDRIADQFIDSPETGLLVISAALIVISLLLTELISNLALVLVFVPVVGAIAEGMGLSPLQFAIPVTLAASCAFMLPMATPPNAIVFAGGHIRISEMVRSGVLLNVVAALLAIAFAQWAIPWWIATFY